MLYSILAFGLFMGKGGGGFDGYEKWVVCALNVHYELNAVISVIPLFCYVDPDRLRESIGIFSIL